MSRVSTFLLTGAAATLGSMLHPAPVVSQGVTTPGVSGIVARVTAQGGASVSWTAVQGATRYHIVRWNAADPACCKAMSTPNLAGSITTWQDGTLPQSGTYTYRIYATTAAGTYAGEIKLVYTSGVASTSDPSLQTNVTAAGASGGGTILSSAGPISRTTSAPTQLNIGPAPTGLQITGGATIANLSWAPVAGASGYQVKRAVAGTTSWIQLTAKPVSFPAYSGDVLPDPRVAYSYQVSAYQPDGRFGSVTGTYTPSSPDDPTEFSAKQTAENEVELTWKDAPGVAKYLLAGPGAGSGITAPSSANLSGQSSYKLTGVPNGTQAWTIASSYAPGGILTTADKWPKATLTVGTLSGRYRVTLIGFDVNAQTVGDPFGDGLGDEVYLAAHVSNHNLTTAAVTQGAVGSLVYGDINGFAGRVTAGTLSPKGGLKTTDAYPLSGGGTARPSAPTSNTLPMLLWEGTLVNDVDLLLIAPSIWESDNNDVSYSQWASGVGSRLSSILRSLDLRSSGITPYWDAVASGYVAITGPGVDHPIGTGLLSSSLTTATYIQGYLAITRQRVEAALTATGIGGLAPGVLAVPLNDRATSDGFAGRYTVYLRVERLP